MNRSFSEKFEIMKILNNLINIYEIISLIENEEINNLIINKIIQFIKEIFESNIEENTLNPNLYKNKLNQWKK